MADDTPSRLSWEDHTLIHTVLTLVSDIRAHDHDAMLLAILREVLPGVTEGNPALAPFVGAARSLTMAGADLRAARIRHEALVRDYHLHRMSSAWAHIQDEYAERRGGRGLDP